MSSKPTVFNYQSYEKLKTKLEEQIEVNTELREALFKLSEENTNLKIRVRILEEQIVATKASAEKDHC